jgi:TRAP-type mannitol/chloroaromatic compound transport system permease small subunit
MEFLSSVDLPQVEFVLPHWLYWGGLVAFPLVFMAIVRMRERRMSRRERAAKEAEAKLLDFVEEGINPQDHLERIAPGNGFTRFVDKLSLFVGVFVAYWTIIAVFVYFYEVVVRYVFNSPTNWAHESMFLMFGMQYVLAGAYAYHHDAHVRVDLFYAKASPRWKAALDILTSFFFCIFILAFLFTAWTFFSSSMDRNDFFFARGYFNEVSFTEWAVAYYPVKFTLVLGGVFLLLQGISRLIKDIEVFALEDALHG